MAPRSAYLCRLGVTLVAVMVTVVALNVLIDPYGYFGTPQMRGVNALKPQPGGELVAVKKVAIERMRPSALILGNSRAEVGFDPGHPAWGTRGLSAYNAAVRGAGLNTVVELLEAARRTREPEVVVLGLDFLDFLTEPDAKLRPYPAARAETPLERTQRLLGAVATVRGLLDSYRTFVAQYERYPEIITDRGFNPLLEYEAIARAEGYYTMFRQRAQENARAYVRKPAGVFVKGTQTSPAFEIIRALVAQASQRGTELHLVIYPYHAQILVMFEAAGLWPAFEQWKRRLAEIVEAGGQKVVLWDFSGFSDYTMENIPGPGDRKSQVRWYWEAGHFKKALGDVVLERILLTQGTEKATSFGARLSTGNVDAHLMRMSQDRDAFRASNAPFVDDVKDLVRRAR
jgi:hypothetical protein